MNASEIILLAADSHLRTDDTDRSSNNARTIAGAICCTGVKSPEIVNAISAVQLAGEGKFGHRCDATTQAERFMFANFVALAIAS